MMKDHAHGIAYFEELVIEPLKHAFHSLEVHANLKAVVALGFAPLVSFMADDHASIQVMVVLVGIDLFFGCARAMKAGTFSSSKFRNSLWKVLAYVGIVVALHLMESVHAGFAALKLDTMAVLYICATEALSILENGTSLAGIHLPSKLKKFIEYIGRKD
jgi:toxin secretion/phage lysis holin